MTMKVALRDGTVEVIKEVVDIRMDGAHLVVRSESRGYDMAASFREIEKVEFVMDVE